MANTPVFTTGAVSAASMQLIVCLCRSLCDESRAKPAQNGLADAHDDEPERACDPQDVCKFIRARDACNQADDPEHRAKPGSRAGAKEDRADDDGNQRQRDRNRPDADAACDGLQNDDQRGQQGQRGQTDDGCMVFAIHKYLLLSLRIFRMQRTYFITGKAR